MKNKIKIILFVSYVPNDRLSVYVLAYETEEYSISSVEKQVFLVQITHKS